METDLLSKLKSVSISVYYIMPELILVLGILLVIIAGFFTRKKNTSFNGLLSLAVILACVTCTILSWHIYVVPAELFSALIRTDQYTTYFKILIDLGGILTILISLRNRGIATGRLNSEFYTLLISAILGAHLLTMSINLMMVFISLELLSISSYVLAGYSFTKKGAEGSLKYFLFGAAASAIMLYGFSILYGITGTLAFASPDFIARLTEKQSLLVTAAGIFAFSGFLYKLAAAPMHIWSPDVYEGSPMPIVAFLSVAPKFAGIAIFSKFAVTIHLSGSEQFDWQLFLSIIAMITIGIGNLSALWQSNSKRMMAYSSIAQSGFLMIGVICFTEQGMHTLLFYSALYLLSNFAVLVLLQVFETNSIESIPSFSGAGKVLPFASITLLAGLISLSGIPPTGGFTSKLFVFASLWSSYEQTGREFLLWLLIFGLLNTVISLFYYLKIPYYAFLKTVQLEVKQQNTPFENFLAFVLVIGIVFLFIRPDVLMGWLNTINFVL